MITINLATRKRGGTATGAKTSIQNVFSGAASNLSFDTSAFRDLPIQKYVVAISIAVACFVGSETWKSGQLANAKELLDAAKQDNTKLASEVKKTKDYVKLKAAFDADEQAMRRKITIIEKLIADRQTPPQLLLEISKVVPPDVWISKFNLKEDVIAMTGTARRFAQLSDLMQAITESASFKDLKLNNSAVGVDDTGAEVTKFELSLRKGSKP